MPQVNLKTAKSPDVLARFSHLRSTAQRRAEQVPYQQLPANSTYSDYIAAKKSIEDFYLNPRKNHSASATYFFQDYYKLSSGAKDGWIYVQENFSLGIINGRGFKLSTLGIKDPASFFPPSKNFSGLPDFPEEISGCAVTVEDITGSGKVPLIGVTLRGSKNLDCKAHQIVLSKVIHLANLQEEQLTSAIKVFNSPDFRSSVVQHYTDLNKRSW